MTHRSRLGHPRWLCLGKLPSLSASSGRESLKIAGIFLKWTASIRRHPAICRECSRCLAGGRLRNHEASPGCRTHGTNLCEVCKHRDRITRAACLKEKSTQTFKSLWIVGSFSKRSAVLHFRAGKVTLPARVTRRAQR